MLGAGLTRGLSTGTFHVACSRILRRAGGRAGGHIPRHVIQGMVCIYPGSSGRHQAERRVQYGGATTGSWDETSCPPSPFSAVINGSALKSPPPPSHRAHILELPGTHNLTPGFTIFDTDDSTRIMRRVRGGRGVAEQEGYARHAHHAQGAGGLPSSYREEASSRLPFPCTPGGEGHTFLTITPLAADYKNAEGAPKR